MDTFLAFLLPGHAAQIGKFFDHFMVTNMTTLVAKLKIHFEKQPNQWKKIMSTLNELATEEGVTMATIKQRFLPLLKGNPLLVDWFMQLFPTEAPSEPRDDEFEELQTKNEQPFEEIPASQIMADAGDSSAGCAIKYMQGRIQYGNRYILPADLSFLATSYQLDGEKDKQRSRKSKKTVTGKPNREQIPESPKEQLATSSPPVGCVHAMGPAWEFNDGEEQLNQTAVKEEPLCDAVTLRMHMNRLNPVIGADGHSGTVGGNEELKGSPKKATEWKTMSINTRRKRNVSPKKTAVGSPKKGSETPTARKKRQTNVSAPKPDHPGNSVSAGSGDKPQTDKGKPSPEDGDWTRDEDKLILEAISYQEDKTEEQVLDELTEAIPVRTRSEISSRFQFLINILKKFS